ncbi:UNVERIFIED_CONTAM: 2-phytyl-1,4-beta-naphthoquinone methyltransferase, chloroplastic [Sesamum latifolium]|uniref:2-phytyl-1,4-beta-naphthoquinone methyltransferase, chloroplastic n=1 Tax=Sesamum latifolium TaxID=2727402 RepID=A0AAW2S4Y6_9LAMI
MAAFQRRSESEAGTLEGAAEWQELFNRIAPIYDKMNDVLRWGSIGCGRGGLFLGAVEVYCDLLFLFLSVTEFDVVKTGQKKRDKVLDVCCGSGDLSFLLSQKVGVNGKVRPDYLLHI